MVGKQKNLTKLQNFSIPIHIVLVALTVNLGHMVAWTTAKTCPLLFGAMTGAIEHNTAFPAPSGRQQSRFAPRVVMSFVPKNPKELLPLRRVLRSHIGCAEADKDGTVEVFGRTNKR